MGLHLVLLCAAPPTWSGSPVDPRLGPWHWNQIMAQLLLLVLLESLTWPAASARCPWRQRRRLYGHPYAEVVLPATWSASLRPVVLPKGGHAGSRVLWKLRWLSAISSLNSALHLVHLDCDLVRRRAHYLKLVPAFAQTSKVVKEMGPPTPRSASF